MKTKKYENEGVRVKVQIPIPPRVHEKFTDTAVRIGYCIPDELFVEEKVHPLTEKVLSEYDCLPMIDITSQKKELTGIETVRRFRMKNGGSAYNYLIAQQVEIDTNIPHDKVALYMSGALKDEMPQGFANTCAEAGRTVDAHLLKEYKHNTYKSDITEIERRTIVLNSLVNKCAVFLKRRGIEDEQFLIDLVPRFIQARSIMNRIKTSDGTPAYMSGAIDDLLLEGCLGATVNLLFIKCPRVVQYYDESGNKRLDILTSVREEVRESVDGSRTYPGSEYFSKYLHDFQEQFNKAGIQIDPIVLVDDMTRIDEYSAEDNIEIPRKAFMYGKNLSKFARRSGYSLDVKMFSDEAAGTKYKEFYKLAYNDVVYQGSHCRIVSEKFREDEIDAAMEYFPKLTHLDATRYVAKVIADLRSLSALHEKYPYGIFITRDAPSKRATMLSPVFEQNKTGCTVLFADPERDQLISEYV